jgi:hypothetical protein
VTSNNSLLNPVYLEGSQDNGHARLASVGSTAWDTVGGGDGGLVRFDPTGSVAYKVVPGEAHSVDISQSPWPGGGATRPIGAAGTWDVVTNTTDDNLVGLGVDHTFPQYPAFAIDPTRGNSHHLVLGSQKIWEGKPTTDRPNEPVWRNTTPELLDQGHVVTALVVANGSTVYAGFDDGKLFRTTNIGADSVTWQRMDDQLTGTGWGSLPITGLAFSWHLSPFGPSELYVTVGGFDGNNKLFDISYPTLGHPKVKNLTGTGEGQLPNVPANTIWVDDRDPTVKFQTLYVGTDVGVYESSFNNPQGGRAWVPLGLGLPSVQVTDLELYRPANELVAATYGRGVWDVLLPPTGGGGGGGGGQGAIERQAGTFALGTFTDSNGSGSYQVAINWGDGSPIDTSTGTVTGSGTLTVSGTHAFLDEGMYIVTATVTRAGGSPIVLTTPVYADDAVLTANTAPSINGTAFTAIPNQVIATFTDGAPTSFAGEFLATIDWGDGTASPGLISVTGNTISVSGGHTYTSAGSFQVAVTLYDQGGSSATSNVTATIAGSITAQAVAVTAREGAAANNIVVATFTDPSPSTYTALIYWGDGHVSTGAVRNTGGTNYSVTGTNTYEEQGFYLIGVVITRNGTTAAIVYGAAAVADAPLTPTGLALSAIQGLALNRVVLARFTDGNPNAPLSDFTATIDWGDGTIQEDGSLPPGTVQAEGGSTFAVSGSHTYLLPGTYTVQVTLSDVGGSSATATSTVTVAGALPTVTGIDPNSGPPSGGTLLTIYGTNLDNATAVTFGSTPATAFGINPDGSITAVAPAHSAGTVDITVTNPYGTSQTSTADQFTYVSTGPTVTSVSPASGPTGGGTTVTITGTNLAGATQVNFGSVPATAFTVLSPTSISATAPGGRASTVDITVVTPYGTSPVTGADQYTYVGTAPTVSAVSPWSGPAAGGALVDIYGANLNNATQVSFGGVPGQSITIIGPTAIQVTAPALAPGNVDITVTTPYGTSNTSSADQYTPVAAPVVTQVSPNSGPTGGGTSVTITGTGFTGASQVLFGSVAATFTVNSDTSITATAPAQLAGLVDITVATTGGSSATSAADQYTYVATAPAVSSVTPNRGPTAGGTTVTINGSNFNGATAVKFGNNPGTNVSVISPTQITATAPAGAAGNVDVTVSTPYGTSTTGAQDQFTYADAPAPAVTGVNPSSGPMTGGTSVTVSGTNFTGATAVYFGGTAAASFTVVNDTTITVPAPAAAAGEVDVTVTTPYGTSFTSPSDAFTYNQAAPSVTAVSPNTGSTAGGTSVTITGSNLTGAWRVYFGSTPAPSFTVTADNSITATAPVGTAATVDITVVTPGGTSATGTADRFTYTAAANVPTVTAVSPSSGPIGGGNPVTITGTNFTGASAVAFGTANATTFTVNSATSITATVPPGTAATVDVTVTTAAGVSATGTADHYTFTAAAPAVSGVVPSAGPAAGGTRVTITGSNLSGATAVKFGTVAAASFTVNSAGQITVTAPAQAVGTYDITVTTPNGTSGTSSADRFTYANPPAPSVLSISPSSGPVAGGTSVTINGFYFTGATAVKFGGVTATSFTVVSDIQITATAPPGTAANTVDITVTTPSGTTALTGGDQFTYTQTSPTVTAVSPTSGSTAGGYLVTITGTNLTGASAVSFGGTAATLFRVNTDSSIAATAPVAAAATVDVTVTTPVGTSATSSADRFTFTANSSTPTVTAVSPSSGALDGGTQVTITGTNLGGASQVLFGTTPATTFTVNSATSLTVTAPPGAAGVVDITVTAPGGVSSTGTADHYTYAAVAPVVTGVSPNTDTTAGGSSITVTGTGFTGATAVNFGSVATTAFVVNSDTSITVTDPVQAPATVDVTVTTGSGTSATGSADRFTYTATASTPTVTAVSPNTGPTGGGTSVTITGTNFSNVTGVFFGSTPAAAYTVVSATSITATAPAATAGSVDVTVATGAGISATSAADQFTFAATAPAVSGVSPSSGPLGGGTSVTITGSNLNGATAVTFGGTAATSFTVISATQITATAPAGSAGTVDVRVSTPYGQSAVVTADQFTYVAAPTVTAINPTSGSTAGGTSVTITGTNFTGLVSVSFGGVAATSLTVNSSTQITATAPASGPGLVDITVRTPVATSVTSSADQFTYTAPVPSVTGVSPSSGTNAGGTSVTVSGSGFTGASAVYFGSVAAASFTVVSDTQITATTPAEPAGTVDVIVQTPAGGASSTSSHDLFTFVGPVPSVTSVSPNTGSTAGGTSVAITGTGFTGATQVSFGGVAAALFQVNSDISITAGSPAHAAGTVDVTVTAPGGTSAAVLNDHFTYAAPPVVTGVSPNSGPIGTSVSITGSGFTGVTAVYFGSAAASFHFVSDSSISATAPGPPSGTVDVTVVTPIGTSATSSADKFTYTGMAPVRRTADAAAGSAADAADATGVAAPSGGGPSPVAFDFLAPLANPPLSGGAPDGGARAPETAAASPGSRRHRNDHPVRGADSRQPATEHPALELRRRHPRAGIAAEAVDALFAGPWHWDALSARLRSDSSADER